MRPEHFSGMNLASNSFSVEVDQLETELFFHRDLKRRLLLPVKTSQLASSALFFRLALIYESHMSQLAFHPIERSSKAPIFDKVCKLIKPIKAN